MFHMKHCVTAKQHRAAAKCGNVSCETFPHPYILYRTGKPPQAACKTRGTCGACRRSSVLPSCGNACRRRRHRCFPPTRNAPAAARQFRHSRNACPRPRCKAVNGSGRSCGCGTASAVRHRPSSRRRRRCTSAAAMYSAAANVNDARRAERLPGHQCFDY